MSQPQGANFARDQLRATFTALQRAAEDEAFIAVDRTRRANPARYWPSRMNQTALDHLREVFERAYPAAIEKRFGQLDVINRKLARIDPDWPLLTPAQIRAVPALYWKGRLA